MEQLERRELLAIQPLTGPFTPTQPIGSMVYDHRTSGEIAVAEEVDRFSVELGSDHSYSLLVEPEGALQPKVELYSSSNALLGSATAASASKKAALQTLSGSGDGTYTVAISGAGSTTGEYTFAIVVNAALEDEELDAASNDSAAMAQDLESAFLAFDSGTIQRAAVVGTLPGDGENFESGRLDGDWTTSASEAGVVEVAGYAGAGDGTYALTLHYRRGKWSEAADAPQAATWTVDLAGVDSPVLSFSHRVFYRDSYNAFDGDFVDSYNADGVAISDDGVRWHPIDSFNASDQDDWVTETVDLAAEAAAAGMVLGDNVQIRFQQYHDGLVSNPLSGRGFDQIMIATESDEDWFRFSLGDGQAAGVTLGQLSYGDVTLELYDDQANLLATGVPAENADWTIGNFLDTTSDGLAEDYFVRVAGVASDYNLIVSRGTDFEASSAEAGFVAPRHLTPGRAVQGAVSRTIPGGPGHVEPAPYDTYSLDVVAGDNLRIETRDLPNKPFWYPEQFDPELELRDPAGNLVAADRDGAGDGRQALILHPAAHTGTYTVHVRGQDGAQGEYALLVTGHTGSNSPFHVSGTTADSAHAVTDSNAFEIHFSEGVLLGSLQAADLTVDGVAATQMTIVDGNTASFLLASSLAEGSHQVSMAAGAVTALDGSPLQAYSAAFSLDTTAPRIVHSSLHEGDILAQGSLLVSLTFSEPMDGSTIHEGSLSLVDQRGIAYRPVHIDCLTASNLLELEFAGCQDGDYTLTLLSGNGRSLDTAGNALDGERHVSTTVATGNGTAGGDFVVHFSADTWESPFPGDFHALAPLGSLVQSGESVGSIVIPADTDTFTLNLDANQTISLAVIPGPGLQPTVSLHSPDGSVLASSSATAAGNPAYRTQAPVTQAGVYRVVVGAAGDTSGDYRLEILLNATLENESYGAGSNDATAQNVDAAFTTLPGNLGQKAVVRGTVDFDGDDIPDRPVVDWYRFPLPDGQSASISIATAVPSETTLELYDAQMNLLAGGAATSDLAVAIESFVGQTTNGAATEYLVRVASTQGQQTNMDYQLVITRDAVLELESDDTAATPHLELLPGEVALGHLAGLGVTGVEDSEDLYIFEVAAGDNLSIQTLTPESGLVGDPNPLDPRVELYDSIGALVAQNDNGAVDGRNVQFSHTATTSGAYRLRIAAGDGTAGEYVLVVNDRSANTALPFEVVATSLSELASTETTLPIDITFSDEILWTSIQASDVNVNGIPAVSVERVDPRTARFGVATLGAGTWQVTVGAGAVLDLQGTPLEAYQAVVITPMAETVLPGSLVHRSSLVGKLDSATEPDSWNVLLKSGQTLAVHVAPAASLAPSISIVDPSGAVVAATAAAAGEPALIQALTVAATGEYRVVFAATGGTTGSYRGVVAIDARLEEEEAERVPNDTLSSAQDLDVAFLPTPNGTGQRAAVLGSLPPGSTVVAMEDFEAADVTDQENPWTFYTSNNSKGRPRHFFSKQAFDGRGFLHMRDAQLDKRVRLEATWTVDLSGHAGPFDLGFWHYQAYDESAPFGDADVNTAYAVGIAISNDGKSWHAAWSAPDMLHQSWTHFSFNLSAAAADAGITIGEGFQIKFVHVAEDKARYEARDFDNIVISTPNSTEDWYKFSLADGQAAALALEADASATLALYDAQHNLLTRTEPAGVFTQIVHRIVDTTTDNAPDTYYVQVLGANTDYTLLVTRHADFESQQNDSFDDAQELGNSSVVLGHAGDRLAWTDPGIEPVGGDGLAGPIPLISDRPGTSYTGIAHPYIEPDPTVAVGTNHVLTLVATETDDVYESTRKGGELVVYDKASGAELYTVWLRSLLHGAQGGSRLGQPRLLFDTYSQRFIVAATDWVGVEDHRRPTKEPDLLVYLRLAVSKTATPTSPDDWYIATADMTHDATGTGLGTLTHVPNHPTVAVGKETLWISGSYEPITSLGTGVYAGLVGIDKTSLLAGETPSVLYEEYFPGAPLYAVSELGESATQYFLQSTGESGESLILHGVRKVSDQFHRTATTVSVPAYEPANTISTKGSGLAIDPYSSKITSAVWRDGSIWASHTIQDPQDRGEASIRWYEIDAADFPLAASSLTQSGTIDPGPEISAWNSAISVDRDGNMAVGFLIAGLDRYLSSAYTGRLASDPPGQTTTPVSVLAQGKGAYDYYAGGTTLMGAQSGLALDPTDEATFWAYNVYANGEHFWASHVGAFQLHETTGDDWYRFEAAAGETVTLETFTTDPSAIGSAGSLNPALELYDPTGNLVASNEDGAADRWNARLQYTTTAAGSWRVRVLGQGGSLGAYSLKLDRSAGPSPVEVEASMADEISPDSPMPTSWILTFSEAVRDVSVQAVDLRIGGKSAVGVQRVGLRSYRYTIDPTVSADDGVYLVQLAAGAVTDVNGNGNLAFEGSFRIDTNGPHIEQVLLNAAASSPGQTIPEDPTTIGVRFDEELLLFANALDGPLGPTAAGIELADSLSGTSVTPGAVTYDSTQRLLLIEIDRLGQGSYTLTLRSRKDTFVDKLGNPLDGDANGTPGGDFTFSFAVDRGASQPWALEHADPLGGLILLAHDPFGWINQAADRDGYTFFAEQGTTIAVAARPLNSSAILTVELVGLAGTVTAASPGQAVAIAPITVTTDGLVTLHVSGDVATRFELSVAGNAAIESVDSSAAAPLAIDASRFAAGMGRVAVVGTAESGAGDVDVYTIDMTGHGGQRIDAILTGQDDADMTGAVLQILDVNGTTVLASTSGPAIAVNSLNYDVGIHDFLVPADGTYSLRIATKSPGRYGLVVTFETVFDTETGGTNHAREIAGGASALGHIGAETPVLFAVQWQQNSSHLIHTLDTFTGAIIHTFEAPRTASTNPFGLNLAFDGRYLYYNAGARHGDNRIHVLDARDGKPVREFVARKSSDKLYGLAYLGGELFVVDGEKQGIAVYSAATGEYLRFMPSPVPHLTGFSGDRSTGTLYAVAQETYTVIRIDPQTGDLLDSAASRVGAAQGMAVMDDELFVSHTGGLGSPNQEITVYDAATLEVLRRFRVAFSGMLGGLGGDGVPAEFEVMLSSQATANKGQPSNPAPGDPTSSYIVGDPDEHSDEVCDTHVGLCTTCLVGYGGADEPSPPASDRLSDQASDPLILVEQETNDTIAQAMEVPLGFAADESTAILVEGRLSATDTSDMFRIELNAGDIISARMSGAAERVALRDSRGFNLMTSFYDAGRTAPDTSPVAIAGRAALSSIVTTPGTYYVDVFDGTGDYFLDLQVLRPGLESQPVGSHQILFLDFDGASVDTAEFISGGEIRTLSPLADFLPRWGLDPETDLDAVIDAILRTVRENLDLDVRRSAVNGDYAASGVDGQFDIEILNSRDHGEQFGNANVSRVVIGGTISELGISTVGIAGSIDVGNFNTEESAVVLLDTVSHPEPQTYNRASLNLFAIDPSVSMVDFVGTAVGNIVSHESGHFFASWHTWNANHRDELMDSGGNFAGMYGLGPDGVFGTDDDIDVDFGYDVFSPWEPFQGMENTLAGLAFGLSTGTLEPSRIGPRIDELDLNVPVGERSIIEQLTLHFSEAIQATSASDSDHYVLIHAGANAIFEGGLFDDRIVPVTPTLDGDRTVQLTVDVAFAPLAPGRYQLTIAGDDTGVLDVDGNPLNATGGPGTGSPSSFRFDVSVPRNADLYNLRLVAGDKVTIWTETPLDHPRVSSLEALDPSLRVRAPSGTWVAVDDSSAADQKNAFVTFRVPESGVYALYVMAESGEGSYVLRNEIEEGPPSVVAQVPAEIAANSVDSIVLAFTHAMDPSSFSLAEDLLSLQGPGGSITPTGHTWKSDRVLAIAFPMQMTKGTYEIVLAPTIVSASGYALDQDGDAIPGEAQDDRYTGSFTLVSANEFGYVLYDGLPDLNPSQGEMAYRLTATHTGYLTVTGEAPGSETLMLRLYDEATGRQVASTASNGTRRVDLPVAADGHAILYVSGTAANVDLLLVNLVEHVGTTVTVHGTERADQFLMDASSGFQVAINGLAYELVPAEVDLVAFEGGLGDDTGSVSGSDGNEEAALWPDHGEMAGSGWKVTVADVVSIELVGGGGSDTVRMYDSPGDDRYESAPGLSTLSGPGYVLSAKDFGASHAYGKAGGNDTAVLHGPGRGRGKFKSDALDGWGKLYGSEFFTRAKFFEVVEAHSHGDLGVARLYDSKGDDTFTGQMDESRMVSPDQDVTVYGFTDLIAYSKAGGHDTATLIDSALDDEIRFRPHKTRLYDQDSDGDVYKLTVRAFDVVHAQATRGGYDKAKLHDSARDELFEAVGNTARMLTQKTDMVLLYDAIDFEFVKAYCGKGTNRAEAADRLAFKLVYDGDWE